VRVPRALVRALGLIKACAARVIRDLRILPADVAQAVEESAIEVAEGGYDDQFPVDVFQTGSGPSTNMNANEVIAALAGRRLGHAVRPNDTVNRGQSSNDVIPTAIHVGASLALEQLIDALESLQGSILARASQHAAVVVIGLDTVVSLAAQYNRFQLATMLPLIAYNLLQQLALLDQCEPLTRGAGDHALAWTTGAFLATSNNAPEPAAEDLRAAGAEVLRLGQGSVEGVLLAAALVEHGFGLVYSIAGPTVLHMLLSAGLLQ
jgi:fumarate hydratase class II